MAEKIRYSDQRPESENAPFTGIRLHEDCYRSSGWRGQSSPKRDEEPARGFAFRGIGRQQQDPPTRDETLNMHG